MKKLWIFVASFAFAWTLVAQEKTELKTKFGKISDEEIKMTRYEKDPDAAAVVLFDKGFSSLGNFDGFERHVRIKIFKKEALNSANFCIPFSRKSMAFVSNLKASAYNMENGKLVETKATNDNMSEEALDKYNDVKKVTIPNVREGSIDVTTNAYINNTEDKIYISPMLCFGAAENPFKPETRTSDIDFAYVRDEFYQFTLTLPEGYKVEDLPKVMRVTMPDNSLKFEYMIAQKDNQITLNTKFSIKKTEFAANQYSFLKQFYAQMLTKMGEQIVLTKL